MAPTRRETVRKSPKELVGLRTVEWTGSLGEGFHAEPVGPNTWAIVGDDLIPGLFRSVFDEAKEAITQAGLNPADWHKIERERSAADRAFLGAKLLGRLAELKRQKEAMDRAADVRSAQASGRAAIEAALSLAHYYHAFAVVENEPEIVTGGKLLQTLDETRTKANADRHQQRSADWRLWNEEATAIWNNRPSLSKEAVARLIKKKLMLADATGTIVARLKKPREAG